METQTKIRPLSEIMTDLETCKIDFSRRELENWLEEYARERMIFETRFPAIKHATKDYLMSEKAEGLYRTCLQLTVFIDEKVRLTLVPYQEIPKIIKAEHAESLRWDKN